MPKRKPPSQRPERKIDETAQAIARLRGEVDSEKAAKTGRLVSDDLKLQADLARSMAGQMRPGGGVPAPAIRRQKTGGS